MNDRTKRLLACVKANDGTIWSACEAVWNLIREQEPEEGERYFAAFLSGIYVEDFSGKESGSFLPDEVIKRVQEKLGDLGTRIIRNLVKRRLPEEVFYRNLWEKIGDAALLPDREAQIAFLAYLWADPCVPYYQINEGCTMGEDEFARRKTKVWPGLRKAFFILSFPFEQRTQMASLLAEQAEALDDEKDRAVYWACLIKKMQDEWQAK